MKKSAHRDEKKKEKKEEMKKKKFCFTPGRSADYYIEFSALHKSFPLWTNQALSISLIVDSIISSN